MGNDSGRGSRSNEPPKLATVRPLHLDDGEGSSATATEDWYETERLTGQITGRTRRTSTVDRPAPSQGEAPVFLDWRHTEATPTPTALQRLRQRFGRRNLRGTREFEPRRQNDDQRTTPARPVQQATLATATEEPLPVAAAHEDDATPASSPRLSLREREDRPPEHPKRRLAPRVRVRVHRHRLGLRRGAFVGAVLLGVGITAVLGIASQMSSTAAKPPHTRLAAVASPPGTDLNTAAKTVIGALAALKSQVRRSQTSHNARSHRRARHKPRVRAHAHAARSRSEATSRVSTPPAAPASSPSTSSYSSSSSVPASSSQPATSTAAPAAGSSAAQRSQPAFGPNGSLGPGRGAPGTQ
jgi:hypothetical protein